MNTLHILHYLVQSGERALPWKLDTAARRIVLLKARTLNEVATMARVYPIMVVIADLTRWDDDARRAVAGIETATKGKQRPMVIGLLRFEPDREQRHELIAAGLDGAMNAEDPDRFLLWSIETLAHLSELSRFEQSRVDVKELALQTRQKLHDLSQPLSAIQGRLQLMAAKADPGDANTPALHEMVRLILEVSKQVMELQRLHRTYS
jgi:signal transduction histidine kinase